MVRMPDGRVQSKLDYLKGQLRTYQRLLWHARYGFNQQGRKRVSSLEAALQSPGEPVLAQENEIKSNH